MLVQSSLASLVYFSLARFAQLLLYYIASPVLAAWRGGLLALTLTRFARSIYIDLLRSAVCVMCHRRKDKRME